MYLSLFRCILIGVLHTYAKHSSPQILATKPYMDLAEKTLRRSGSMYADRSERPFSFFRETLLFSVPQSKQQQCIENAAWDMILLSFIKPKIPRRTNTSDLNKIELDYGSSILAFRKDGEIYNKIPTAVRFASPETNPHPPNSSLNPPWHIHFNQYERFKVIEGSARFYLVEKENFFSLAKIESKIVHKGDQITIMPGQIHTFRNASTERELEIQFNLSPSDFPVENFFRNTQSYRSDCSGQNISRSIWQVCLFNRFGQIGLCPNWLIDLSPTLAFYSATLLGRSMNIVMGKWIGQHLMGLQAEYEEYSKTEESSKKSS